MKRTKYGRTRGNITGNGRRGFNKKGTRLLGKLEYHGERTKIWKSKGNKTVNGRRSSVNKGTRILNKLEYHEENKNIKIKRNQNWKWKT